MIHTTIGVYANGDRKSNGVTSENLAAHIHYNLNMRPGRAFFVDGWCLNTGYLSEDQCDEIEKELRVNPRTETLDTAPYV